MKTLLLIALMTLSMAYANSDQNKEIQTLWPQVTAWSSGVDLRIHNTTDYDYSCSGSIYIRHMSGRTSTEYYFGRVYARFFESRYFSNRYFDDRIISASHSINCYRL